MGVFTYESEVVTTIPPAKMFKACILDGGDKLIPKIVPYAFKSFEYIKASYSVIKGDALMNTLDKITCETKLEQSSDGGCVCKTSNKYYTIGDFELKEEGIKAGRCKEKALGMFKAVEAYLLPNPDAY
ncbi:hypothetical protein COLO4_00422 [Corchorus olitorius]|uniref:Bet v I/Major latex protein domain-containing protein n=1 Tax=Corchorus olitorius TaxID=93759 RepID=A0A1R3L3Y4_9ROSI|nr:hypothetical protein COLO4_00422 [Corchorus olitorius]